MKRRAWRLAVGVEGVDLRALRHVEQVLDRERVQPVLLRESTDDAEVAQAVDVDPPDRGPVRAVLPDEGLNVLDVLDEHAVGAVVDRGDAHGARLAGHLRELVELDAGDGSRWLLPPPAQETKATARRRRLGLAARTLVRQRLGGVALLLAVLLTTPSA